MRRILSHFLVGFIALALVTGCSVEAKKARHRARAEKYFKAEEFEKAKLEYLNVLRADPRDANAYERMGVIWLEQGAPLRAGPFLARAREIDPDNLNNRLRLARLFSSMGAFGDARKEALAVLQKSPTNGEAIHQLADASQAPEELAEAEQFLQRAEGQNLASLRLAAATLALRKGDMAATERLILEAVAIEPQSRDAHTALASLSSFQGNQAKAGEEFKAAAELAPLRSSERLQYAQFRVQTGAIEDAKAILKSITSKAIDYIPAWRGLAEIAFAEKKFDEALASVENIFKYDPDNPDGRMLEAQALLGKGDGAKALQTLERLNKAYPQMPAVKYQFARAYLLNNNPTEATAALNEALAMDPEMVDAKVLLAEINLRNGQAQPVLTAMTELLAKHPSVVPAQLLLAEAYRALGRLNDSAAVFREQIRVAPQNAASHVALGMVLRQQKQIAEARSAFEKALEIAPGNVSATDQLVDLDLADGAFDAALQRAQRLREMAPASAASFTLEGKIRIAQKNWDEAEVALTKALEVDPNFSGAYDLLVTSYITNNKLPQAATRLEEALKKRPNSPIALMVLAMVRERMENYSQARDAYERLLAMKPDFPPALNNLAYLYAERLNQLDRAQELARKARTLQPADASIADTLGWILYKQGDPRQALTLLQESAGKMPDSPEIQFHLGMAAYGAGQTEIAHTALKKAAASSVDFPGKNEIAPRLALLEGGGEKSSDLSTGELEALLKERPDDPVALRRLGDAYASAGDFIRASDAYEHVVKLDPKFLPAIIKLAELNAGPLRNKEKAMELAKKARELAPTDPRVAATLGNLAYEAGNHAWAFSLLQTSARQLPDDVSVMRSYALAAYSVGRIEEARKSMLRVQESSSDPAVVEPVKTFLRMTAAVSQTGSEMGGAEAEAKEILEKDPKNVPALMLRAAAQVQRGEVKPAENTYNTILNEYPEFAPAQAALAAVYLEDPANVARAYDLAMKARKTLPDDPELSQTLGGISYQRKEFPRAIQLLQDSNRKRPLDSKGLYYLGMAYAQNGQSAPARESLDRAVSQGLKDPLAANAAEALAALDQK